MRTATLATALLLAACHGAAPSPPVASAPARDARLVDGDLHGFAPSDDLVALASRLGDPTDRARVAAELKTLPADRRVAVLRAGIRHRDATAARTCAGLLLWNELDDWEQGLTTRLLTDAVVDPAYVDADGDRVLFSDFFERMSGAELPYMLDQIAAHPPDAAAAKTVSYLHKVASAEHLPQLGALAAASSGDLRVQLLDVVQCVITHTDQHREDVAAALLATDVEALRARDATVGDGLPPSLVTVLSLEAFPFDPDSNYRKWAWRWLADTRPSKRDVAFLLQLDAKFECDVIAWVLRDLDDPRIDPWLAATTAPTESRWNGVRNEILERDSIRLGALARRGRTEALGRLVASAGDDGESLAVLLAVAPTRGRAVVEERVFGEDVEAAMETLRTIRSAWEDAAADFGVEWDDAVFEGFADVALARKLDGLRLAMIGVGVPRCRTRAIAAAAVAAMPRDRVPIAEDERPLDLSSDVGAFLETAAPEAFRDLLRAWSRSADEPTRATAIEVLATIGDPASGPQIVEALRARKVDLESLSVAARSPCPEMLAYLRERARDDFVAAVAYGVATGLPEGVDPAWLGADEAFPAAARDEVCALLLDGRWKDAVARALAAAPDPKPQSDGSGLEGLHLVDDDRVRAYLRRLQERREFGRYPRATGGLAMMGDSAARAEFERAVRVGRYRWCDGNDQIAFGDPLRALRTCMDLNLLETNCCRLVAFRCYLFDHCFDVEFRSEGGGAPTTPAAEARRWFARSGGRFVPSRLGAVYGGDRCVPAPR